jgi:hypothetical protein
MFALVLTVFRALLLAGRSRSQVLLENLALRHQLSVDQRTAPKARAEPRERLATAPAALRVCRSALEAGEISPIGIATTTHHSPKHGERPARRLIALNQLSN